MPETKSPISECQNCGKTWNEDQLNPAKDLSIRVSAGEPMPSGECPECGALCQERNISTTASVIYKEAGLHWLELPPVAWRAQVEKLKDHEKQELSRWLDSVVERAARLQGYVNGRGASGCGDDGHAQGVKWSNNKAAQVRKALGFTYARRDLMF